jgi:hypothetical protein
LFARIKKAASSGGGLRVVLVLANGSGDEVFTEGLKGGGKDEIPKMPTAAGKILH